jgi:hypothetical protein
MPRFSTKQMRASKKAGEPDALATATEVPQACPLCSRPLVPGPSVDEHHLVPKSRAGRDKFLVHRVCHTKIHATLGEKELAQRYNTWEALRVHPQIAAFIDWVQRKPPEFMDRNARPRGRR